MKILFQVPHLNTVYAGRTIYAGYKDAFEDLGHEFKFLTADLSLEEVYDIYVPDILFTSLSSYYLRYLSLSELHRAKDKGLKVFVNTPFWKSPLSKLRVNEVPSLSNNDKHISLIKSGNYGDVFYNICEPDDERMNGFEKEVKYKHYTIPLAANKKQYFYEFDNNFKSDISFIGTYLPEKQEFMKKHLFPLKDEYDLNLYGQDWTKTDKFRGYISKFGMYFNLPYLKTLQRGSLGLDDERKIYSSSTISLNIHEDYQKEFGGDCNERTFKIPISGGFEITDDVGCIRKYFTNGKNIIIAENTDDWFDKIAYYIKYPDRRDSIIDAGRNHVLKNHTYNNRVETLIEIYKNL